MGSQTTAPAGAHVPAADQRIVTYREPWSHFDKQLALRGDRSGPRIAFLDGALELMSPSSAASSRHTRSNEISTFRRGMDSEGGSQTGWAGAGRVYLVGAHERDTPDLAIEVVWTSGGIDELEIYRRLGVSELWRWKDSRIEVYVLRDRRNEQVERSTALPDPDVNRLCSFLDYPTAMQAVKAFRKTLYRSRQ